MTKKGEPYYVQIDYGHSHRYIVVSRATGKQAQGTTKYQSKEAAQKVCDTKNKSVRRPRGE